MLEFHELNFHLDAHTGEASDCKDLRLVHAGAEVILMDLHKAYLRIYIHPLLWLCQTAVFKGWQYCLKWMGFRLNIMPLILRKFLNTVLS